jgi:hypothetical protein
MPVTSCEIDGKSGYKWGHQGHCYPHDGSEESKKSAKKKAISQGVAIGDIGHYNIEMKDELIDIELSTSFDFDGTLSTKKGQDLWNKTKGTKYVITARDKTDMEGVYAVTDRLGIPRSRVIATGSNQEKVKKVKSLGIDKHIDNNPNVVKDLGTKGKIFINKTPISKFKEEMFEVEMLDSFSRIGIQMSNDIEIIHEEDVLDFDEDLLLRDENNLLEVKFANEKINGLYVYYRYAIKEGVGPKVIDGTRDFCKTMLKRDRLYTKDEIIKLGVNNVGTDIWKYRGGFWNQGDKGISVSCRHQWKRVLARKNKNMK